MDVSNHTQSTISRSNSPASSNSELEKEISELDVNGGRLSGEPVEDENGSGDSNGLGAITNTTKIASIKKRISSSRTPTRKAKRVRFYRNGDRFYAGIVIPVSNERYRYVVTYQGVYIIEFDERKVTFISYRFLHLLLSI